jgi:hypothetical protein
MKTAGNEVELDDPLDEEIHPLTENLRNLWMKVFTR